MSLLPIFVKLAKRRCLLVGAGAVALQKIPSLLSAEADLHVIAPRAKPEIVELASAGKIELVQREFHDSDLDQTFLVIAATDDAGMNAEIYRSAVERNILCNSVDDPPHCDFYFGSIVSRGDLQIAISTAGESPAFAQCLRHEIDEQLPTDLGPWLRNLGELRREVLAAYPAGEERKLLLQQLAHREVCESRDCPARKFALESKEICA
jgi:siroheme synthase-like protein